MSTYRVFFEGKAYVSVPEKDSDQCAGCAFQYRDDGFDLPCWDPDNQCGSAGYILIEEK